MTNNDPPIKHLYEFLRKIISSPSEFNGDNNLKNVLRSQGALAKFKDERFNIVGSSINTMKRQAELHIPGGFMHLDQLRLNALRALSEHVARKNKTTRNTKSDLTKRLTELISENQLLREDLLLVTFVLEKSFRMVREYANELEGPDVARCKKEQRVLLDMLSLKQTLQLRNGIRNSNES